MKNRPTLKTVAEAAGVSLPTVSQVMRGVGRISKNTREQVHLAAVEVGYVQDHRAASVRTGRSNEIAIIVHDIANSFNAELIYGVSKRVEDKGYFLSIMDAHGDAQRLEQLVRFALAKSCAGLLWVPSEKVDPSLIDLIQKQKMANVTFLRGISGTNAPSLRIANARATAKATRYLMELGHRHIIFAGGVGDNQTRRQRLSGYQDAMEAAGHISPQIFDYDDTKHGGFDFATNILLNHPDITAVVCNGDEFAIGLCLGLKKMGKQPGVDISVIGFDDIDEAELITPALTTLSISPVCFGKKLAEMLLREMDGVCALQPAELIEAELIIRETTQSP